MSKYLKELEQKEVFLIYQGINRKELKNRALPAYIRKVAKVFCTFQLIGNSLDWKFRMTGDNGLYGDYSDSFLVFKTEQEALDHLEADKLRGKIRQAVSVFGRNPLDSVSLNNLTVIAEILGVNTDEN